MTINSSLVVSCLSVLTLSIFQTSHAASAFDSSSPWMFGNWNGKRTELQQQGYDFSFGYTGELANVLDSKKLRIMVQNMPISFRWALILT